MHPAVNKNLRSLFQLIVTITIVFLPAARGAGASPPDAGQPSPPRRGGFAVGHTTRTLNVTGTLGEERHVDIHLWYPARRPDDCDNSSDLERNADDRGCEVTPSVYRSRLNGVFLGSQWDPLSWAAGSTASFENLLIARGHRRFPAIVFSHGHQNNAIDYVYTLETLASFGFIVAAPDHLNGTQDDVLIDYINLQAPPERIPCFDGLSSPCARSDSPDVSKSMIDRVSKSMIDRMHDITAVLDALPAWFGDRVDLSRVGVLGHSRGTVSALVAAGGSAAWGLQSDPRVKAIMGLAIGVRDITIGANLGNVTVPTRLVAGTLDATKPVSLEAFDALASTDKAVVLIDVDLPGEADHRHFDSGLCAQVQSAGGIAARNTRAILDLKTLKGLVIAPLHRRAMDFCRFEAFTNPTDPTDHTLADLVASLTGFRVTPDNVPTTGIDSAEVKNRVVELAVTFFQQVLQ